MEANTEKTQKQTENSYREREQDRNGSHLAAAAPVLFPYFVRDLFSNNYIMLQMR